MFDNDKIMYDAEMENDGEKNINNYNLFFIGN